MSVKLRTVSSPTTSILKYRVLMVALVNHLHSPVLKREPMQRRADPVDRPMLL